MTAPDLKPMREFRVWFDSGETMDAVDFAPGTEQLKLQAPDVRAAGILAADDDDVGASGLNDVEVTLVIQDVASGEWTMMNLERSGWTVESKRSLTLEVLLTEFLS